MSKSVEKAYQAIRSQILDGILRPGDHLKEEDLAATIGVSRTPVREALRRLSADQFVRFAPNHGTHVASWSDAEIAEIFALRGMLEGYAAARAADRITDAEWDELRILQAEIDGAAAQSPPDLERVSRANVAFHRLILRAARSERLTIMVSWVIEMPVVLKTFTKYAPADLRRSLAQHRELLDALRARDPDWARSVMQSHVAAARNVYRRAAERQMGQEKAADEDAAGSW